MTTTLQILCKHGSSLDGRRFEFTSSSVSLGRHPTNDVAFDPERDRVVSGRHAELRVAKGTVWLHDLGSSNGTFVNGRRIEGPVALRAGDRIVLGENGVAIEVDAPGLPAAAEPSPAPNPTPGPDTIMAMVSEATQRERQRSRPLVLGLTAAVLLLLAAGVAGAVWFFGGGADEAVEEAARREARDEAAATARGIRRASEKRLDEIARSIEKEDRSFRGVFPLMEPSVYPVLLRKKKSGKERFSAGGGTCWVVAPGVLATNAHVAKAHYEPGTTLVVRGGDPVRDLEVQRVELHPGYGLWARLLREYRPIDPNGSRFLRLIPACDVALMWCRPEAATHLGAALEIAPAEGLHGLARGTPAATLGFPVEGVIVGALERSKATSEIGNVSQVFDFFLEKNEPAFEQLLAYNLKAEGGASGSPVVNLDGKVIAVHSAGNFKFFLGERISQGSTTFGQRADLVRQLVDGTASRRLTKLEPKWRRRLADLWSKQNDAEATIRALKQAPGWPFRRWRQRRLRSGTLRPGQAHGEGIVTKGRWAVLAMVTGKTFGRIGLRDGAVVSAKSWTALSGRRPSGFHRVEVYQPPSGTGTVSFELWLLTEG